MGRGGVTYFAFMANPSLPSSLPPRHTSAGVDTGSGVQPGSRPTRRSTMVLLDRGRGGVSRAKNVGNMPSRWSSWGCRASSWGCRAGARALDRRGGTPSCPGAWGGGVAGLEGAGGGCVWKIWGMGSTRETFRVEAGRCSGGPGSGVHTCGAGVGGGAVPRGTGLAAAARGGLGVAAMNVGYLPSQPPLSMMGASL